MSKREGTRMLVVGLMLGLSVAAHAQATGRIKLGTLAPRGSTWETLLKEMGQKWSEASSGAVKLVIYPGGVMGNEGDMVNKTRVGELQAVAVTAIGLHDIAKEPQAIDVPMIIDSDAQLEGLITKMSSEFERAVEAKGYVVLGWSNLGFVRFFSTKPHASMKDFKQGAKVYAWSGDPAAVQAWRASGFNPIVISSTDIESSLQSGLIDTVALPPLYAFSSRIFKKAHFMLDLKWAALTGAMIVKKDAWNKIPADVRPKLLEITHEYMRKIDEEVHRMDADAMSTMKAQGLVVVPPASEAEFKSAAVAAWPAIRGKVVPAKVFDEVKQLISGSHEAMR